jgi:hypothetical protein
MSKSIRIHEYEYRQFYINFEDGSTSNFGDPKLLKYPNKSKTWKELKQISGNEEIKSVGWKTVKI